MLRCSVYIATSLDGFIARKDGALDWLPGSDGVEGDEDYGFHAFFATIDCLVMGRNTYEMACKFHEWPYHGKRVMVLSRQFPLHPQRLAEGVEGTAMAPKELLQYVADAGAKQVYVDGGKTIQSFLREHLIQELTITQVPILIGGGMPLFGPLTQDIQLAHVSTSTFANGFVQSKYTVLNTEDGRN